jgi:hypothetical protein
MNKHNYTSTSDYRGETPTTTQEVQWSWASAYDPDEKVLDALRRWLRGMEEALGQVPPTSVSRYASAVSRSAALKLL